MMYPEKNSLQILLADDHLPFRVGMKVLLEQVADFQVVGEAETGADAISKAEALQPDVLILDCQLPDIDGPTVAQTLTDGTTSTHILALSAFDDTAYVRGMLTAGVTGYLLKSEAVETIITAVRATHNGQPYFSASIATQLASLARQDTHDLPTKKPTPRELEVLQLLAQGLTNGQIGHQLGIAERTVRFHVENLFDRLDVESRTEAVVKAIRLGWVDSG